MKKTVLSILLVLLLIVGSLPMTAMAAEADAAGTGATTFNVSDADHLRSALQTNGDIIVNVKNDIEFTMPDGYQWSEFSGDQDDTAYWTVIAQGSKTINLNGHRLYITDNQITKAKYKKVTYTYTDGSYTLDELEPNGYVRDAFMFRIDFGATLTVNGYWSGSEVMFDAQMPAKSQLIDYQVLTQRSLFELNGGRLYLNGGEYQAGRRKTVNVTSARLMTKDWETKDGVLWPSTHYYGDGEYAICGSVVSAENGEAYISGGTLIAHGFSVDSNKWRNAVLRTKTGHIFMYDGTLKGYCGADAVQEKGDGYIWIYAGEANTDAREMYLYPYGHHAVSTESNYCAVPVEPGKTSGKKAPYGKEDTKSYTHSDRLVSYETTYSPTDYSIGMPNWEDGSTNRRTILTGTMPKVFYDGGEEYFPTGTPGTSKRIEYFWTIQKLNASNKWETVTGWLSSGANHYITLSPDTLESGATYRMKAKREEYWGSTHNYTAVVQSETWLVFTVSKPEDYVISAVDLTCPAPVGGQALNFDPAQVTGLPEYTTCTRIVWYKNGTKLQYQGDKAVTGESYEVWIRLTAQEGSFAHWTTMQHTARINGQSAGVIGGANAAEMEFKYTFTNISGPTQIKSVAVFVNEPVAGSLPVYSASYLNGYGYEIEDYDASPYQNGVAWFRADGGGMRPDEPFEAGKTYRVNVSLVPVSDAYLFATSGLTGTVNGKTGVAEAYNDWTAEENIGVSYTFTLPIVKEKINRIAISVPAPAAGQKITPVAYLPDDAHYTFDGYTSDHWENGVCWADENGKDIAKNSGAVFEAGKSYTITVAVVPTDEDRYEFADESDLIATVNGLTSHNVVVYEAKKVIFVLYPFTVPAGGYIIGDADTDGSVTILDATAIQRTLASLPTQAFDDRAADADRDGSVTILDATAIQRYLASYPNLYNIGTET